jgi:hypothetical protein
MERPAKKLIFELALRLAEVEKQLKVHERSGGSSYDDGLEPTTILRYIKEWTRCNDIDAEIILE